MQLPTTAPVNDFILDLVRVAPEDWPEPASSPHAKARLTDLKAALQNPDVLFLLTHITGDLFNAISESDKAPSDRLMNQFIGEARGLRQTFEVLNTLILKLQEIATRD
jgi:hypothetical protein